MTHTASSRPPRLGGTPGTTTVAWRHAQAVPSRILACLLVLVAAGCWYFVPTWGRCLLAASSCAALLTAALLWSREAERWITASQWCELPERLYEQGAKSQSFGAPRVLAAWGEHPNGAFLRRFAIETRRHSYTEVAKAAAECGGFLGVLDTAVSCEQQKDGSALVTVTLVSAHGD